MDINIVSAVLLCKAAVPRMRPGGALVFVSSYTAFNPASAPISMCAAGAVGVPCGWHAPTDCPAALHAPSLPLTSPTATLQPCPPAPPRRRYAVSKTALLGLTKALAEELGGEQRLRVNCVAPGIVPTKVDGVGVGCAGL